MLDVHAIPAFTDNYIWLIQGQNSERVIIVDPGDAEAVLHFFQRTSLTPAAIFITHHHNDHVHGVKALADHFNIPVYGPRRENIFWVSHSIDPNTSIALGQDFPIFEILDTPGHTAGHISYYAANQLFCGDTLFAGGCGRLLGGTAEQLFFSLQSLKKLPKQTAIYSTHEYTQSNLKFALAVDPDNEQLKQRVDEVNQARLNHLATLPTLLSVELATNPFMRTDNVSIKKAVEHHFNRLFNSELALFTALRQWKDHF